MEGEVSKFLGAPFGLNLNSEAVDKFLCDKIDKKLRYWITTRINGTGRVVICNGILVSSLMFFLAIWSGSKAGVIKVISKIQNYLWTGTQHNSRARIAWDSCCRKKKERGLGLVNPEEAVVAMMCKWIVLACESGLSNFKRVLRHRLSHYRPYARGNWPPSLLWFTLSDHSWVIYTSGRCCGRCCGRYRGRCCGRYRGRCLGHLHLTTVLLLCEFFIWFLQKEKTRKKTKIYKRFGKGKTPMPRCCRMSTTVETG